MWSSIDTVNLTVEQFEDLKIRNHKVKNKQKDEQIQWNLLESYNLQRVIPPTQSLITFSLNKHLI